MHIYDLEKFRPSLAHILTRPNWSLNLPLSPHQVSKPDFPGLFFYRLTKWGTFYFLLVIFPYFPLRNEKYQLKPTGSNVRWIPNSKTSCMAFPRYLLVKFHGILWRWLCYWKWGHWAVLSLSASVRLSLGTIHTFYRFRSTFAFVIGSTISSSKIISSTQNRVYSIYIYNM